jgi:two-component system sensor histidine kinase RegB
MALAREQNLTDLGGVVAAAAHELGTPLATIKLVTSPSCWRNCAIDPESARGFAALIREQADRCRDILRDMGKRRQGRPACCGRRRCTVILHEAAEPHMRRGKRRISMEGPAAMAAGPQSLADCAASPEIIHGLRNLIQNAVDFSRQTSGSMRCGPTTSSGCRSSTTGADFRRICIGRIGDPFLRGGARSVDRGERNTKAWGWGCFIAKTLLERTGARVQFGNGSARSETGAVAQVTWPRDVLEAGSGRSGALGENQPFRP